MRALEASGTYRHVDRPSEDLARACSVAVACKRLAHARDRERDLRAAWLELHADWREQGHVSAALSARLVDLEIECSIAEASVELATLAVARAVRT